MSSSDDLHAIAVGAGLAAIRRYAGRDSRSEASDSGQQHCRSAKRLPQRALTMENARDIKAFLRDELHKTVPDLD